MIEASKMMVNLSMSSIKPSKRFEAVNGHRRKGFTSDSQVEWRREKEDHSQFKIEKRQEHL